MSFASIIATIPLVISLITPINTTTEEPRETPSTNPSNPPIEQEYYLEGKYWVDNNNNNKQESSETATPKSKIIITFDNGDRQSYLLNKSSITLPKLKSRIKNIVIKPAKGYYVSKNINDPEKYLDNETYKFDISLKPIVNGTIVRQKRTNGREYTITYTIINTGYHELKVKDSLNACKNTVKLAPQSQISCDLKSSYFVKSKPLKINNTITLTYQGNLVKEETIKTVIDEKSPEIQSYTPPPSQSLQSPESSVVSKPKMTHNDNAPQSQVDSVPNQEHKPHHPAIAIVAFIILIVSILGIALLVLKRHKK